MRFKVPYEHRFSGGVYIIVSKSLGESYIGSTKNFWDRYRSHRTTQRREEMLNLVSSNDCEFKLLQFISDKKEMLEAELRYIQQVKPTLNKAINFTSGKPPKWHFENIELGGSMLFELDVDDKMKYNSITNAARQYGKRSGKVMSARKSDIGITVYRIK